jgi:hypothetical protein
MVLPVAFILRTFNRKRADFLWHFAEVVYVLRTTGGEEDPPTIITHDTRFTKLDMLSYAYNLGQKCFDL